MDSSNFKEEKKDLGVTSTAVFWGALSWRNFINSFHKLFLFSRKKWWAAVSINSELLRTTISWFASFFWTSWFLFAAPSRPQRFHMPNSWCRKTWQCALSRKLQHMARGFGDASRSCPIFSSVSAPPLIWSACVVVKKLTTSETEKTLSCFLGILTTPNSFFHLMYEAVFPSSLFENWLVIFIFLHCSFCSIGLFIVYTVFFHFTMSQILFFLHSYIQFPRPSTTSI